MSENNAAAKSETNFRFSVVMPVADHTRLEDYVRERAYRSRTVYTKSDFVREAVLVALKKAEEAEAKEKAGH